MTAIHATRCIRSSPRGPALAGPLWFAAHATVAERYALGRKAMDSIYSGGGTFWIVGFVALFVLPAGERFQAGAADCAIADPGADRLHLHHGRYGRAQDLDGRVWRASLR